MKTRYLLPILLSVAAVLSACNKEQAEPSGTESGELVTLEASIGAPGTKIHFTGDKDSYTETKWQAGDCLWVRSDTQPYWEAGDCFTTSAADISSDGHSAKFTGRTRKDGKLAAAYPYMMVNTSSDNDEIWLDLPGEQTLVPGDCAPNSNPAVAFLADGSTSLSMKYVLGAIKFSLTGENLKVSSFELLDAKSSNALHGSCVVTPDYEAKDIKSIKMLGNPGANRLRLVPSAEITLGSTPLDFYVMLPEGSLSDGFVLKALDAEGKALASLLSEKVNTITRGKVVKMPVAAMKKAGSESGAELQGSGIEADPYLIESAENLINLSNLINSEESYEKYAGKVYKQTADIDMNLKEFSPIGANAARPFKGKYLGSYKVISNLSTSGLDSSNPASGLFGYAENATIDRVVVSNRSNGGNFNRVGGIVGYAKNCTVNQCSIKDGELGATANMCAGIIADMDGGKVSYCSAANVKISNTKNYAGGIVAHAHGGAVIEGCFINHAEISAANEVGGIVGKTDAATVTLCNTQKSVVSASAEDAGGIVGWSVAESTIKNCKVYDGSTVKVKDYYAGGIVGLVQLSTVEDCKVEATEIGGGQRNGGIAGYMKATPSNIINCSVSAGTKVSGSLNIGGITGWMDLGSITGCSFSDSFIDASGDGAGGIVGRAISKNGGDNLIDGCWVKNSEIKGTFSVAGIVGYAYPDAGGPLRIINSGVRSGQIHASLCDTGGDPAKGDCMCGGIIGWMRLKDAGSKAYIYNCYAHFSDGFVCDLAMSHPSLGGLVGYGSISSTGLVEIANCVSSLTKEQIKLAGSVIADTSKSSQVGALFGVMPNSDKISISDCHYIDDLSAGVAGESVVLNNLKSYPEASFSGNSEILSALNTYASSQGSSQLKNWTNEDGKPVIELN